MIDWIAFDADDTLWRNEEYYLEGRAEFQRILQKYDIDADEIERFDRFEVENIRYFGYGAMSFVLSMIEIGIEMTGEKIHPGDIRALIQLAKDMLTHEVEVFDGVEDLLKELSGSYPLMLITKGDLLHQKRKFEESGLANYFQAIEVVSDKTPGVYQEILDRHGIEAARFIMIGNSLRSDVLPLLEIGAWGMHLADHPTWSHEDNPHNELRQEKYLEAEDITGVVGVLRGRGILNN